MTTKSSRHYKSPPDCRCAIPTCRSFTMNPVREYGWPVTSMMVRLCNNCEVDFKRSLKPAVVAVEHEVSRAINTMQAGA